MLYQEHVQISSSILLQTNSMIRQCVSIVSYALTQSTVSVVKNTEHSYSQYINIWWLLFCYTNILDMMSFVISFYVRLELICIGWDKEDTTKANGSFRLTFRHIERIILLIVVFIYFVNAEEFTSTELFIEVEMIGLT